MVTAVDASQGSALTSSSSSAPTRPESIASSLNPLLARGKLKKAAPPKKKKDSKKRDKAPDHSKSASASASASTSSGAVTPTGAASNRSPQGESAPAEGDQDDEVSDLADQLLSQLEATRSASSPDATSSASSTARSTTTPSTTTSSSRTSVSSHSNSKRGKLHHLGDDMRHFLLPNSFAHIVHSHPTSDSTPTDTGKDEHSGRGGFFASQGISRQKLRKMRKANDVEQIKHQAQQEVLHANDHSIEEERQAILKGCTRMGVRIKEIDPDGHCLYSAIADQANHLRLSVRIFIHSWPKEAPTDLVSIHYGTQTTKETYSTTRKHAATYMRAHPDDFLPFLESSDQAEALMTPDEYENYCATVENTAEWGGEPEIRALAKHYNVQVHVLQAGTDLLKVGEDDLPLGPSGPIRISYHRKMYGLGEHYNSLVPATYAPPTVGAMG
ncbi:BQ2448_4669 [Microbotryum intermedium]|uniref:BQ2448_4669 protein n=1 Tax=Microbotryum intermedium TaxID=269621 RepID=A0A238FFK0_9BASI|nr:BQ2448_4669 [Microbotryum intermedium]